MKILVALLSFFFLFGILKKRQCIREFKNTFGILFDDRIDYLLYSDLKFRTDL